MKTFTLPEIATLIRCQCDNNDRWDRHLYYYLALDFADDAELKGDERVAFLTDCGMSAEDREVYDH